MKVIAGCILRNERGEYLLVQERQEKAYGLWNIPAGWANEDETPQQAAIRETQEEVGFTVEADSTPIYQYSSPEKGRDYYAFLAEIIGGTFHIQESELLNAEWLSFNDIQRYNNESKIREPWIFEALAKAENENSRH